MTTRKTLLKHGLFFALLVLLLSLTAAVSFAANEKVGTVTAKVTERKEDSLVISWETKGTVSGYILYKYDNAGKKFVEVKKTTKTKYRFTDLSVGEYYVFAVRPYLTRNGTTTQGTRVKVRGYTTMPAVTGIKQSQTTLNSHKLSWTAVKGAKEYSIFYYKETEKKYALLGTTSKTTCNVSNLKPTKTYYYKIKATHTASNGKVISSANTTVFQAYTLVESVKAIKIQDVTDHGCLLEWTAVENADGYQVLLLDSATGTYQEAAEVKGTSCSLCNLPAAATSACKIRAFAVLAKEKRLSEPSESVSVTTRPSGTTVTSGKRLKNGSVKVTWTPQDGCDGYVIFVSSRENGVYGEVAQSAVSDVCEATFAAPTTGTVYVTVRTYVMQNGTRQYSSASEPFTVKAATT